VAPTGLPQVPQNRNPGWSAAPQEAQPIGAGAARASGAPQSGQDAKLGSFSRPQRAHFEGFAMCAILRQARGGAPRRARRPRQEFG
jgi:hypothetical protein